MKDIEKIKKLIAQLKTEAENEFELYRISVLERDLIQGLPEVVNIDKYHQEFNGKIYKLASDGHFNGSNTAGIHRDVWTYYRGAIPQGRYVIHHIDFDKANNDISNLQLLTISDHQFIHNPKKTRKGSPLEKEFVCDFCGKKYTAFDVGQKTHYCSKSCLEKAKKTRLVKTITCQNCGKEFEVRKYDKKTRFCSKKCAQDFNHAKATEIKTCPVCSKNFVGYKYRHQQTCSSECGVKWRTIKSLVPRVCENCGKEFQTTPKSKKRFCDECAEKKKATGRNNSTKLQERYQQAHEIRTCPVCGKEFDVYKRVEQECCSKRCRSKLRSMREAKKKLEKISRSQRQNKRAKESIQMTLKF